MPRNAELIVTLGYNGTGKSELIRKIVESEVNKGGKALVIMPDDREWSELPYSELNKKEDFNYTGAKKHIFLEDFTLDRLKDYFFNGLLIFEDCRSYLTGSVMLELHNLLIRRRQKMLDIIAVGHGFTEVPPKFFTFAGKIILFQTKDNIDKRKDVIREFDKIKEAQERINKKSLENFHYYEILNM